MVFNWRAVAQMRKVMAQTLKERCDIYQEGEGTDVRGYPTHGLTLVRGNVPCRVIRAGRSFSPAGEIISSQEAMTESYRLIVPYDTPLAVDMVVDVEGERFQVVNIWTKHTDAIDQQATISKKVERHGNA